MTATTISLTDYEIGELIHQSDRILVYRGLRKADSQPVVIKLMRNDYPSSNELVQFRNQYTITKNLDIEGIVKPHALERYGNGYALIMEDFGGISLEAAIDNSELATDWLSISQFLNIAIQLADILHDLYHNRVIHKDIKPANILIHPQTRQVKLIDFSISSLLPKETQTLQTPKGLEGTLAYLSPEQTGRMNRGIDYRSDFYSLGVTFYELLSGKLPFESDDPLELVYCHIAKMPLALNREEIPAVVADIVMKLMAKNAEDRYQSALGLKSDLETCLNLWQEIGKIESFALAERDRCDRFLIPEKLYGREPEVQTLLAAFLRVASVKENPVANPPQSPRGDRKEVGRAEMMLVAGFSGIGKTAVINEVHKPIVEKRGYFIRGKFDQFNRNVPFFGFVQAFQDLMGQLLGESDADLADWKAKILEAAGKNGRVLVNAIPELERIIGKQPPVLELDGSAAQTRFNLLFQKFIAIFTTPEHPLVIFLDDLQWADSASLNLMNVLMGDRDRGHLLLLGAYRDNEVFPAHPLILQLDELKKNRAVLSTITLEALAPHHINQLVADTLGCSEALAQPLTELVYQKTRGNPFFTTQFLKGLHQDGLIAFNLNSGCWECDLVRVRSAALTDDVVEFMAKRLQQLPAATQTTLKLAACIGNQFDLATLAVVSEESEERVAARIWSALQDGLILPMSDAYKFYLGGVEATRDRTVTATYRFLHDRVQQAAYSLISADRKQSTHLTIGKLIFKNTPTAKLDDAIFSIIVHLNRGGELLSDRREKKELAHLNLMAGRKAIHSTAYAAALEYLSVGLKLLPESCWTEDYKLALSLHEQLALAHYLNGNFSDTECCVQTVLERARTRLDSVKVCEIKIQALISQHKLKESVSTALDFLEAFDIEFPKNPTSDDVRQALEALKTNLAAANLSAGNLLNLPRNQDPVSLAISRILTRLYPALYFTNPTLLVLALFRAVELAIRHGNDVMIPYAYTGCGFILCTNFNDFDLGFQFGQLAIDVLNKLDAKEMKGRVFEVFYGHIKAWKSHLKETIDPLLAGYQSALEVGDLEYAGYNATLYCYHSYFAGVELSNVAATMATYHTTTGETLKHAKALYWQAIFYESILNLQGKTGNTCRLLGTICNEDRLLPIFREQDDYTLLNTIYLNKLILSYLFEDYSAGIEWAVLAEENIHGVAGLYTIPIFYWYDSLARMAYFPEADRAEQLVFLEKVASNQERFKQWMHYAPMNYTHKFNLVEAERYRVAGQKLEAIDLYDRAIAGAKENDYIQEEALANELAAKFYLNWGKEKVAAGYMQEAYYCYYRWGANAKIADLEKRYSHLLAPILERQKPTLNSGATILTSTTGTISQTTAGTGELLDLATLMKASRTLSEDISLEGAIANLMEVAKENAGAETIALMLLQEQVLMLVAKVAVEETLKLNPIPVENSNAVPLSIVNKVKHGQQPLLLENASQEAIFAGDPYIRQHQPQSILCLPLIVRAASLKENRGQPIGILYLENNRVAGAFTSDRAAVLNLLCSQAAISLENARLYRRSQQTTGDLQQALTELQQAQLQLVQNEKMATLGNLVAGVAHEINNPLGCVGGNVKILQDYLADLFVILEGYRQEFPNPSSQLAEEIAQLDLDFLLEDIPKTITSMQEGVKRLRNISKSLRIFSRTDTDVKTEFNLHDGIDSTLLILEYRLKGNAKRPAIEIIKNYGDLPDIKCYAGQLNQVFMNLLTNAIDALEETNQEKSFAAIETEPNRLTIRTELSADRQNAIVGIADNGTGMPNEVKAKIFEQGFTTKGVGKGTGLGMAIARQIVEEKHGGAIACLSELGKGSEFTISLPLD